METVERRFQFLADTAPVMIWMSGPDKGCTWFNKPWLEFVGRSMDNEIGDGWSHSVHPEDFDRCLATYTTAFDDRRPFSMEYRLRRHDGEYRWLLDNGIPLFEADDGFTGYIGSCIDITERKEAEESLRREQELSESIINTISDIVLVLDTTGRIIRFNPFMERLTGWRLAEVRGRDWFETFLPRHDRKRIRELFRNALDGERVRANVNAILTKDGREREIEWYDAPLTSAKGDLIGLLCTGQDLTDRKQTEKALHGSEERMRAILNTAADAIVTIDRRGTIIAVNPATERMFGYSREEFIGSNVNLLMPSPYREHHDGYLSHFLATGEAKIIGSGREVEGRRKDGTVFPIDLAVSEVADLGLFTGIIRDITERKAEHERLIQSERLAALGEAMASLAHESRNALARSQGNLNRLARRLQNSDELLQLIQGAQRANRDIGRQFEEVREYAAPIRLRREHVHLLGIVDSAWEELAADRKKRKATMILSCTDQNLTCEADSFLLRNVFRNLLENALAACDDPVEIEVGIREERYGGVPALRMAIQDNGPGFPPDATQRAFDPFFTTKTRGTGLGLAIVKRVVEAHGGVVAVGSGSGRGAEVVVTLPRSLP